MVDIVAKDVGNTVDDSDDEGVVGGIALVRDSSVFARD